MPTKSGAAGILSDDFYEGTLGGHWTVVDPLGGGSLSFTGASTSNARMVINCPSGSNYNYEAEAHYRVLQTVSAGDFTVEIAIDSLTTLAEDTQVGIYITDNNDSDGLILSAYNSGGFAVYVDTETTETWTSLTATSITATDPYYLRIVKSGTDYACYHGSVRASLTAYAQGTQSLPGLVVDRVGPFIGNWTSPYPASSQTLDYFMELTSGDFFAYEDTGSTEPTADSRMVVCT